MAPHLNANGVNGIINGHIPPTPKDTPISTKPASTFPFPGPQLEPARKHAEATAEIWNDIQAYRKGEKRVLIDGFSLDIPSLVAVALHGCSPQLDRSAKTLARIDKSVAVLREKLENGEQIYGVNTGFGGSADTRTTDLPGLQRGLIQHQNAGILSPDDISTSPSSDPGSRSALSLPTPWVRGLMLARLSSVVRGHSAVSQAAIDAIEALLTHNLTPVIPARGSISASGDLIPLSYLAGVLQGNPDIYVRVLLPAAPTPSDPNPRPTTTILPSPLALRMAKLSPLTLGAKEGLGLLNGTAASASVAAITLQEANCLALLTQMLTAMMCEAMAGSAGSFAAFIAAARPHRGQIEAAANIRSALAGSRLAQSHTSGTDAGDLAQDRYALRTAPQWIGPYLEDLALATEQVSVELVSTTDNPLVDPDTGVIHHGGNFQATSLTSAMDKTRVALAQLGALLFAQANELVDPARNRGLPPNLAPDNPSTSFFGKGLDISVAAYSAELAFLAAPAGIHMRSAEMHNQSVNSMALLGARMAAQSVEVASMLAAAALVLVCQGLDLRVLRTRFADTLALDLETLTDPAYLLEHYPALAAALAGPARMPGLLPTALAAWDATGALDLGPRCVRVAERVTAELTAELQRRAVAQVAAAARTARESNSAEPGASGLTIFAELAGWTAELACNLEDFYETARADMYAEHANITPGYLGSGTRRVYEFVRGLGVGLHKGREDDPLNEGVEGEGKKTIGGLAGRVYAAIRGGEIYEAVVEGLRG